MKSGLVKLSLALLSAVFVLGCMDQGPGPVGVDGLVPQFAPGNKGKPDKPGGDGGSELAEVTLGPPMEMASLLASGQNDDVKVSLGVFFSGHPIEMAFDTESCVTTVGAGGRHDGDLPKDDQDTLEDQLDNTVSSGSFTLKVDKVAGTGHILVSYQDEEGVDWTINFERESLVEPTENENEFKFTGTIEVSADGWGGAKGKRGRRAIACEGPY